MMINRSVNSSTSCSIFPLLNCTCYQSNGDINFSQDYPIYSHLYCHGNSLTKKTFEPPFGYDSLFQNQFRTVSIEFFLKEYAEIYSNQFNSLSMLFAQTDSKAKIEISIRFNGFYHITFNQRSFTSNIFQGKHQNRHLSLHFIPAMSYYAQFDAGDEHLNEIDEQLRLYDNCFSGLTVSQLHISIYTKRERLSSLYPFENVFNNTNIGELHFYGSIIPPGAPELKEKFKGQVRSLKVHRQVDRIDSKSFPYYSSVYSYNIHSTEPHSIDLYSFLPLYDNLRGLEIIKPHFDLVIDQFIPTLDSLTIDVEHLDEYTLYGAQSIHNLKLGPRLRRINAQVFYGFPPNLQYFDLSDVDLSEMTSESRCYLIHFIHNYYTRDLNIIFPRLENLTECDCARLFLLDIQFTKNSKNNFNNELSCSKQCCFSDCHTISNYFLEKFPIFKNDRQVTNLFNKTNDDLPSIDLFDDPSDVDIMNFLSQSNNDQTNIDRRPSTNPIRPSTNPIRPSINPNRPSINPNRPSTNPIKPVVYEPTHRTFSPLFSPITTPVYESTDEVQNEIPQTKQNNDLDWIKLVVSVAAFVLLMLILISAILCFLKRRKRQQFQRVPVHV